MNSKKLLTLLVLTTMLIAMVPMVPFANAVLDGATITFTNDDKGTLINSGEKGHTIIVEGAAGQVASGYEVMIYWDKIQDWDGVKGHLNTTEVDDDGGFEVWFEVPESPVGNHYVWFTATDQETKIQKTFAVVSDVDISTSSGLANSKIYADLWGFAKNKEVGILFIEEGTAGQPEADWNDVVVATGAGAEVIHTVTTVEAAVPTAAFTNKPLKYAPVYVAVGSQFNIYHNDGTTQTLIAHSTDGTTWTPDDAMFTSAALVKATGMLSVTFTAASEPAAADTIEVSYSAGHFAVVTEDQDVDYDVDDDEYDGTVTNGMIEPGKFDIVCGAETYSDTGSDGKLYDDDAPAVNVGSINYVTGDWELDLGDSAQLPADGSGITATYDYFDEIQSYVSVLTSSGVTTSLGSWENRRITIPDDAEEGQYYIVGFDGKGNSAYDDFEIGAVITLGAEEGAVGDKVEIEGEGFPASTVLECHIIRGSEVVGCHLIGSDGDDDETNTAGEFSFEIIIPQVSKKDDDFEIRVRQVGGGVEASTDFEVTGLASVSVDPDFGPQGSSISITGTNFQNIKDKKIKITLVGATTATVKESVKLDADGSFEVSATVPTENDGSYKLTVEDIADDDGTFNIDDDTDFRIGTILVLLSDDEGVVGEKVVLTGNGFTDNGEWNATFGDITLFNEEQASATGLLRVGSDTPEFFVPQVEPGAYTITVWDVDAEISVETEFTVTAYTVLELELSEAPNEYNLTISGWNWPEVDGSLNDEAKIDFLLWNSSDEWTMNVIQYGDYVVGGNNPDDRDQDPALLNGTGFLNDAWWIVPDDETLSMGDYWINATIETDNDQEYFMQLSFTIGDIHKSIAPRKATFRIGDTVSFKIQHTFGNDANHQIKSGDMRVYDPDGTLYWSGDDLDTWTKVQTWYEVPTSAQTANGNPMILLDDAPLGEWSYKWRESDGDTIASGTFNVEAAVEDIIGEQIDDLNQAIDGLTGDLSTVSTSVAGLQSNINSAIQAANAAVEAANAATTAVNAVAGTASEAATAAQAAATAAEDAQKAANGLTTLVYGAIGASLVAALAAIVSLMQISRRIAG